MVQSGRSNARPIKGGWKLKGLSLDSSQGMPSGLETWSMSSMLYANSASIAERGESLAKSLKGKDESSSNSSGDLSGCVAPWYHLRPPSVTIPPFFAISAA